jgi:hypothetical protein
MDKSAKFHIYEIFDLHRSISFHVAFLQRISENNCLAKKKRKNRLCYPSDVFVIILDLPC